MRAYEIPDRPYECPVACLKMYFEKLPNDVNSLFPKPMNRPSKSEWYCKSQQLGKNTLGNLMVNISTRCLLSKRYTNHCVRVTTVEVLREQGYTNEQIALVTGHKNPNSVQRYCKKRRDDSYFHTSETLQAGSSTTVSQKVIPIGNAGKIVVKSETLSTSKSTTSVECSETSKTSFVFSGQFTNCHFEINQK